MAIVDNPGDSYQCFYCGPPTTYDFNPMAPDDEGTSMKIQENLKSAFANAFPRPFDLGALAGTVPCPQCNGHPKVRRLTPNFAKAFGLDETWDFTISKRVGARQLSGQGDDSQMQMRFGPRKKFLEYPASPPNPVEMPEPTPQKGKKKDDEEKDSGSSGFKLSHKSAFSLDDYVLNFASDDEGK